MGKKKTLLVPSRAFIPSSIYPPISLTPFETCWEGNETQYPSTLNVRHDGRQEMEDSAAELQAELQITSEIRSSTTGGQRSLLGVGSTSEMRCRSTIEPQLLLRLFTGLKACWTQYERWQAVVQEKHKYSNSTVYQLHLYHGNFYLNPLKSNWCFCDVIFMLFPHPD